MLFLIIIDDPAADQGLSICKHRTAPPCLGEPEAGALMDYLV